MKLFDLPPVWLLGALAIAWGEARVWPRELPLVPGWLGGVLFWIGLALIAGALLQMAWARTSPIPRSQPDRLVTTGLFRWSRNPIYLGDLLVLAGCCLSWGATLSLVLVPALFVVLTRRFIEDEEARLRSTFGAAFDAYVAQVRRWL